MEGFWVGTGQNLPSSRRGETDVSIPLTGSGTQDERTKVAFWGLEAGHLQKSLVSVDKPICPFPTTKINKGTLTGHWQSHGQTLINSRRYACWQRQFLKFTSYWQGFLSILGSDECLGLFNNLLALGSQCQSGVTNPSITKREVCLSLGDTSWHVIHSISRQSAISNGCSYEVYLEIWS